MENTSWPNKGNHIKTETQDEDDDETFKSINGDNNPQAQKIAPDFWIRDNQENIPNKIKPKTTKFYGFLICEDEKI